MRRSSLSFLMALAMILTVSNASAEVWGDIGLGVYPTGTKMAANQLVYKPLFFLSANLNAGNQQGLYLFADAAFYTEKAQPGITTSLVQGDFDFTKREFDLSGGLAYRYNQLEGRLAAFSMNNLNRGLDNDIPVGFKDGSTAEIRWYYGKGEYFTVSQQYISAGYIFSNTLVDTAANPYKPGFFVKANGLYEIPQLEKMFVFGSLTLITTRGTEFKELDTAAGAGYKVAKKTEIRAYYERDFGLGNDLPDRDRVVIGVRQIFGQ